MKKMIIMGILLLSLICSFTSAIGDEIITLSLVNQDPDPALAGDVVEIRIGVENQGGESAENVILEILPSYPISILPGESNIQNIGTLRAYQTGSEIKIVKFKARIDRDAIAGEYELKINRYQEGKESVSVQSTFSIDVESKESAEVIYIDQVELIPGKITPLKFTVNNVGSGPLRELSFKWETEDDIILPVGSDNTRYIKYIDIGGSAELEFNVIASANADPDLYKIDLTLTYYDPITGEETEINTKAGIYVGGPTDFDVAFSGSSNGEYSFAISNIGSVSASSVTVRIPDQTGWRVSGSNSVIIGNLNEGDYTIASFNLQQAGQFSRSRIADTKSTKGTSTENTQKTQTMGYPRVMLEIVYTDSRGNRNTVQKEVPVGASSPGAGTEGDMASMIAARKARENPLSQVWNAVKWVLLIIILVAFIFVRKKYKKGRLKDPDYTYADTLKDVFAKLKK